MARWHVGTLARLQQMCFFVPVDEIRQNDYDLTFNKYKEVVREKVVYDDPKDVFARIEALEEKFAAKQQEFKTKYL